MYELREEPVGFETQLVEPGEVYRAPLRGRLVSGIVTRVVGSNVELDSGSHWWWTQKEELVPVGA
jgi:hypothetical protein